MAGYNTKSVSMEWLCLYLTKFPEIQRKLNDEIDAKIGSCRNPSLHDELNMPYAQAVINETLRMSSIASFGIFHKALKDVNLKGIFMPKNTLIIGNQYAANFDEATWGSTASDHLVYLPKKICKQYINGLLNVWMGIVDPADTARIEVVSAHVKLRFQKKIDEVIGDGNPAHDDDDCVQFTSAIIEIMFRCLASKLLSSIELKQFPKFWGIKCLQ
ncbi:unnamed protein product [Allacma fusca]|uniref:Cytochrome P450 n=1 Tax=Allacma fusca TaxID=39272 RepID=A0A8J2LEI2_9HEXA|nr:unnamed protein product [Allacma fusca]